MNNRYKTKTRAHRNKRKKTSRSARSKHLEVHQLINKGKVQEALPNETPTSSFADLGVDNQILDRVNKKGYEYPTDIQIKAIPTLLSGQDLIGIASTGTGKTAAFLIPIIQELLQNRENQNTLIITPTRELAIQVASEFKSLSEGLQLYAATLIGGGSVSQSIKQLKRRNHVIIGTPGRLLDMVNRRALNLINVRTLVLDEFDRMLDMGFVEDVLKMHDQMDQLNQTLLFSATRNKNQQQVIDKITKDALVVQVRETEKRASQIEQDVVYIPADRKKVDVLCDVITSNLQEKVILFCDTKRKVNQLHKDLKWANIRSDIIHGDKSQRAREVALKKFKNGNVDVLVATDVVARGIDISDVTLVINYERPTNYSDYIHRIGRTGRAGKQGRALTFID